MDLIDQLRNLATKAQKMRDHLQTEEATKNAIVMPFIAALGYDVFDPMEVIPEFTADVGIKKGEKVDYAIMRDGKPIILFECKNCGDKLERGRASQLFRYFTVTEARIAILTDGIIYQFFTDLEAPNRMDEKPFMELNILDLNEQLVMELKKMTKSSFDLEQTLSAASELKYTKGIRSILAEEAASPSEEMVRLLTGRVYSGRITQSVKEQFTDITKRAFQQFVNDSVNTRIKAALAGDDASSAAQAPEHAAAAAAVAEDDKENRVATTEEELEGYYIVKSILRESIDPDRIAPRDTISYYGVLLDDNNRKPICRLHFNRSQKYIGLFDEQKNEDRKAIEKLDDIYQYAGQLRSVVEFYEGGSGDQHEEATSETATTDTPPADGMATMDN